jgi:hypothetical protein
MQERLQLMWHHNRYVVLMLLGNADELVQICLRHAIFWYQEIACLNLTLCMLICGDIPDFFSLVLIGTTC